MIAADNTVVHDHFLDSLSGTAEFRIFRQKTVKIFDGQSQTFTQRSHRLPLEDLPGFGNIRPALFRIVGRQLLADDSISDRTKEVFVRVAVNGEKPESVAEAYGITRNAVDQMKARMKDRLQKLANALIKVDDEIG